MTAAELLESLTLLDEQERVEAKRSQDVGKSVLETVCALANEPGLGGGWILLGVHREEMALFPTYEVEGLENADKLTADLATQCAGMFNRPLRVDIRTELLAGKVVAVVFVPEAAPQDKPVFLKAQGLPRGAFRRIGSTDQHCTEDDLLALFQGRQQESFDAGLIADAELQDIAPEAVADYRQARAEANPDAEELRWTDEQLLQALGCIRRDAANVSRPTVAGIVLFGTPQALRRCLPMTRVDYIRVPGREWVPDPERRFDTVELRDPLFRLIRRTQAAILDDLPKAFGLPDGELQRTDRPVIPQRVIREAIVNALMHRSYRSASPIQIIRYANRLEVRNPGFSLKSPEHLGDPGSTPRNPKIAAVLHETRFAETKGSGVRVMREMAAQAGLAPPLFESDRGQDLFVARFLFHHFLGEEDLRWLARFKELNLSDADARAIVVARENGAIDNSTYREINRVDTLVASVALRRLRDAGLLEQKGRGSATWYRPTPRLLDRSPQPGGAADAAPATAGVAPNPTGLSTNSEGLSPNPAHQSPNPPGLAPDPAGQQAARRQWLGELPDDLAAQVATIGKRRPPPVLRALILALCAHRAWRADDLATLLRRRADTLRAEYLRPMLKERLLVLTRPEKPNDPQQAYRAVGGAP